MKEPAKTFEDLVVWQKANDLGYVDTTLMNNMICEVSKMLEGYSRSILNSEF